LFEVAAEHATDRVPVSRPHEQVGELRNRLAGQQFESADDIAVLRDGRLIGLVTMERLLGSEASATIGEVMDDDPPTVAPGLDQEAAAWKMVDHGECSLAVVGGGGEFVGLIPPHRMLEVLLTEHDEDLARMAGFASGTVGARRAAEEPVARRLRHRLPWLLLGLVGAMGSAVVVGGFEEQLDAKILLAFFLPAVVYMADAVGTQTEALLIRGLSVGVTIRSVARRELLTGLWLGALVGAAFFPFVLAGWGDADVALAVAAALVASCSIATLVAMLLPWLFQRAGRDPAFGSGPLATVIQDLLSIATYLAIAVPLAT
jgi:magnesium transporter